MPVDEPCAPQAVGGSITKTRAIELVNLSMAVYEKMKELGIKDSEHCHFGRVMQDLLRLPD